MRCGVMRRDAMRIIQAGLEVLHKVLHNDSGKAAILV
jgi:hypothetical protein